VHPHQEAAWTRWICSFHLYCPLPWTFLSRRYHEKYLWSLAFEEWLWDFSAFVMPLLCLHDNSAVCVSAFGYLKLQKPKIFRFVLTRVRILYQITDFPVWLNCRIPCHWFACYWITIVSIVSWLVLKRTPLNSNNSGGVFSSYFANECYLFLPKFFIYMCVLNFLYKVVTVWVFHHGNFFI